MAAVAQRMWHGAPRRSTQPAFSLTLACSELAEGRPAIAGAQAEVTIGRRVGRVIPWAAHGCSMPSTRWEDKPVGSLLFRELERPACDGEAGVMLGERAGRKLLRERAQSRSRMCDGRHGTCDQSTSERARSDCAAAQEGGPAS